MGWNCRQRLCHCVASRDFEGNRLTSECNSERASPGTSGDCAPLLAWGRGFPFVMCRYGLSITDSRRPAQLRLGARKVGIRISDFCLI